MAPSPSPPLFLLLLPTCFLVAVFLTSLDGLALLTELVLGLLPRPRGLFLRSESDSLDELELLLELEDLVFLFKMSSAVTESFFDFFLLAAAAAASFCYLASCSRASSC